MAGRSQNNANTKTDAKVEISTLTTELENKEIQTIKTEEIKTETPTIDIEKLIADAVSQAISKVSASYEEKISTLTTELEKSKSNANTENKDNFINPNKRVTILNMSVGSASFINDAQGIYVKFDKTFDKFTLKFETLDKMFAMYREWFENFEIVILDDAIRNYYNLEDKFQKMGADEGKFKEMLEMPISQTLDTISSFQSHMVAMAFLKYFIDEHLNANSNCVSKLPDVDKYFRERFGLPTIYDIIAELKSN